MKQKLPSLIPKLNSIFENNIPNSSDFGLDKLIGRVFRVQSDMVDQFEVQELATQIIKSCETDKQTILDRQEVLNYFIQNPQINKIILDSYIPKKDKRINTEEVFSSSLERSKAYLNLIKDLALRMPPSQSKDVEGFRDVIKELSSSKDFISLEKILKQNDAKSQLFLSTQMTKKDDYWSRKANRGVHYLKVLPEFSKEFLTRDTNYYKRMPYDSILRYIDLAFSKQGQIEINNDEPVEVDFEYDERLKIIKCEASCKKFDIVKSILNLEESSEEYRVSFRINENDLCDGTINRLQRVIADIKIERYKNELENYSSNIEAIKENIVELRYYAALANYFIDMSAGGLSPKFMEIDKLEEKIINISQIFNPLLIYSLPKDQIVTNDVNVDSENNVFVITGSNNNGKTNYKDAIAFSQCMTQAGWKIFAESGTISPKNNILTHYIKPGDFQIGESRYARELSRTKQLYSQKLTSNSLVLLDESFSGTSPKEAQKQINGVLETLARTGATVFMSSHHHGVIDVANQIPYAKNLHCVIEQKGEKLIYTYKILEGSSQESNGAYLARQIGVDKTGLNAILEERAQNGELILRDL